MDNIYEQDRFYKEHPWLVVWMYYNPDSCSGGQFVENHIEDWLLREAIQKCGDEVDGVFNYILENCLQCCLDQGTVYYDAGKELFESAPDAIGMTRETLDKIKEWFGF